MATTDGVQYDEQEGKMTVEQWAKSWDTPDPGFHSKDLNEFFEKHKDKILTKARMKVFVPLCGKAVEMKWLAERGHEVVGLEAVANPCRLFFEDNDIPYTVTPINSIKGDLYKSSDDKMNVRIYCCDFFEFTSDVEAGFEAIWDSGALTAVDIEDQGQYMDTIKPLMTAGCRNLTELVISNSWPSGIPIEKMKQYLGDDYTVTEAENIEASKKFKEMDIDNFVLYLITKQGHSKGCT